MRAFAGNDVVDLGDPARAEHFPEDAEGFAARHLSSGERVAYAALGPSERFGWFWERFAAKEAAFKAFDQAGIPTPRGGAGYAMLEVSADGRTVTHFSTGIAGRLASLVETAEFVHAVFLLEGEKGCEGRAVPHEPDAARSAAQLPFEENPPDAPQARLFSSAEVVPVGESASDFARDLLVSLAARAFDAPLSRFFLTSESGRPRLLDRGSLLPCSVSLSHSGRFAAASLLLA